MAEGEGPSSQAGHPDSRAELARAGQDLPVQASRFEPLELCRHAASTVRCGIGRAVGDYLGPYEIGAAGTARGDQY